MASINVVHVIYMTALAVLVARFANAINFCEEHRFIGAENSSQMQLTKEAADKDYAVDGEFKSLHCCAKGYRSIEW